LTCLKELPPQAALKLLIVQMMEAAHAGKIGTDRKSSGG
jgi:hypothetical protein